MHTIRLLETAVEILSTGVVMVRRPNFQELLDIRNGKRFKDYDEFVARAEQLIQEIQGLDHHTKLPVLPEFPSINQLLVKLHKDFWKRCPHLA